MQFQSLMKKVNSIFFILLFPFLSQSQTSCWHKNVKDTFYLNGFSSDKVVSYRINHVTILVDYDTFNKDIINFKTEYENDKPIKPIAKLSSYKDAKKNSLKILKNIIQELSKQVKSSDTVFLVHTPLDERTLRQWELNNILVSKIETGNCTIFDSTNTIHPMVIRTKGEWTPRYTCGRRYYLPGRNDYFIDMLDRLR
jgi:hypothetical protein